MDGRGHLPGLGQRHGTLMGASQTHWGFHAWGYHGCGQFKKAPHKTETAKLNVLRSDLGSE